MLSIAEQILQTTNAIGEYLSKHLLDKKGFDARTFYGEAFTLALLANTGHLTPTLQKILVEEFDKLDQSSNLFHWEFNHYALLNYQNQTGDTTFSAFINKKQFCNHPVTNWVLLKNRVLLQIDQKNSEACLTAKNIITKMQESSGLVKDEKNTTSFQYHCFSLVMLIELWHLTGNSFFKSTFLKGIQFIRRFILSSGNTLYIGRGQQQIFGYTTLLYALSEAYQITSDSTYLADLNNVFGYMQQFKKSNGTFPLVLREGEATAPFLPDLTDPGYLGWYSYNNYYDYLPFAGFFLFKTYQTLCSSEAGNLDQNPQDLAHYSDKNFTRVAMHNYDAVLAKPEGYLSNDMAFPYLSTANRTLTPCYGGDQFTKSLFNKNDLPLPYFPRFKRSLRAKSKSWLNDKKLTMVSPLGLMKRSFEFKESKVMTTTRVWTPFKCIQQYLFNEEVKEINPHLFEGNGYTIHSNAPLHFLRDAYSASGRSKVFGTHSKDVTIIFRIETQ